MAKSNYPEKIDTSIEIPAVRDNIAEIGSDVINSIRSAIFNIERTLGINPQGSVGMTVSSRLSKSLDANGGLLKEAIDKAGVLSGPISDKDVSKTAAISERKLNLDYPTNLLQEEISQVYYQLNIIDKTLSELSSLYATHVHPSAKNRHPGTAISIAEIANTEASEGVTSYSGGDVQDVVEKLFASHINYDGSSISEDNRSHESNQIFFDNTETSAYISSNDAQGAIEDVLRATTGQLSEHQDSFHANSIERYSRTYSLLNSAYSRVILSEEEVSFSAKTYTDEEDVSTIFFSTPIDYSNISISKYDVAVVVNGDEELSYRVNSVNLSSDGLTLESLSLYGRILSDSEAGATVSLYKSKLENSNFSELLLGVREYESLTSSSYSNADIIQVSNPNAVSIVSDGLRPKEISLTNRYIKISVDNGSDVSVDLFDSSSSEQTIDTIIKALNEQFCANRLSVLAYRVDSDNYQQSEIAIVHRLQNTSVREHTIEIKRGSDDAIDSLGLGFSEGNIYSSNFGKKNYILGESGAEFFEIFSQTGLTLVSGTSEIGSYDINPLESGVRNGHVITIYGTPNDDGTYIITNVTNDSIVIDKNQLPDGKWVSTTSEDAQFIILSDSVSLNGMAFEATTSPLSASSIIDVFLSENRKVFFNRRLTYERVSHLGSENLISTIDFEGDISIYTSDNPGEISLEKVTTSTSDKKITISLDGGTKEIINEAKNKYIEIKSGKHNISLTVFIKDSDSINSKIISDGSGFSVSLFGNEKIDEKEVLNIGRVHYEAAISRVTGFGKDYPKTISKVRRGGIGVDNLGTDVRLSLEKRPHFEKRSNGVISGLEITSVIDNGETYTASISAGVCYVKGKRFEVSEALDYVTHIETGTGPVVDKFYIAIDEWGHLVFSPADAITCGCTLDPYSFCIIGSVEYSSVITTYDLRLFLDNLDYKLLNSITVSPQPGMGHFLSLTNAIAYAKRFSEIFPEAGVPTIHLKSGNHKVFVDTGVSHLSFSNEDIVGAASDFGLVINFPVNIIGEGESSVIDVTYTYTDLPEEINDRKNSGSSASMGRLLVFGPGVTTTTKHPEALSAGTVLFRDLSFRLTSLVILDPSIVDSEDNHLNFNIKIENVKFDLNEKDSWNEDHNKGIDILSYGTAPSTVSGNIFINNCSFENSLIYTNFDSSAIKNFSVTNCALRGTTGNSGEDNFLFNKELFDFNESPPTSNIEVRSNICADNSLGDSEPEMANGFKWGDRVNRNMYIGGKLGVGTAAPEESIHINEGKLKVGPNSSYTTIETNSGADDIGLVTIENGLHNLVIDERGIITRYGDLPIDFKIYEGLIVDGPVKGDSYSFSSEKTIRKTILASDFSQGFAMVGKPNAASLVTHVSTGLTSILMQAAQAGTEFFKIRLPLTQGQTLKSLSIFYIPEDPRNAFGPYDLEIGKYDIYLDETSLASFSLVGQILIGTGSNGTTGGYNIPNINITIDDPTDIYYAKITRYPASSITLDDFVWGISFEVEVNGVEGMEGLY